MHSSDCRARFRAAHYGAPLFAGLDRRKFSWSNTRNFLLHAAILTMVTPELFEPIFQFRERLEPARLKLPRVRHRSGHPETEAGRKRFAWRFGERVEKR